MPIEVHREADFPLGDELETKLNKAPVKFVRPGFPESVWPLLASIQCSACNCDNMGTFRAYAIRLPGGGIVKSYGQIEAKKLFWKHLGTELRNANDDCILPGSCDIPRI